MINIIEKEPEKISGTSALFVTFNFNQEIVNIIKSADTAIYNKKTFAWELPVTSLAYLLNNLTYIDDIVLKLQSDDSNKEYFYPKLKDKYKVPAFQHQLEGIEYGLNHKDFLLLDQPGLGKALSLDTNIVTDTGYKKIKDIQIGDIVFDQFGNKCSVTDIFDHEYLNMYEIEFTTGEKIKCCEDHIWPVIYNKWIWDKSSHSYFSKEIRENRNVKWLLENNNWRKNILRFYFTEPVQFEKKDLPIDPYILGCLIGDRCLTSGGAIFVTEDKEIYYNIKDRLPDTTLISKPFIEDKAHSYSIVGSDARNNPIKKGLHELGLAKHSSYNKFIPKSYLLSSINDRIELLQGLMDTDGTASSGKTYNNKNSNNIQFGTSSEQLKDDFIFLIESLGGYTTVREFLAAYKDKDGNKKITHKHWTISIHLPDPSICFKLTRKKNLVNNRLNKPRRKIKAINKIDNSPGRCLTVDSPSHTYLIDHFLVSHNTATIIHLAEELKEQKGLEHCLIICGINTLKANWKKEIAIHSNLSCRVLGEKISKKGNITYSSIKERAAELLQPIDAFFIITNVETLRSDDIIEALKKTKNNIGMVVVDEVHRCSNSSSQQGHNLLKLKDYEHKIGLTGTLLTNTPLNAYLPLRWIGVEKSTLTNFKSQYCEFGGFGGYQVVGYKNIDILKNILDSCSLRRTKDMLNLPPKTVIKEIVEMEDKHRKFYENIQNGVKEECDKIELNANNILALTTRLRQATSCPSILTSENITSTKLQRAAELSEDIISQGDKVVIMCTFKESVNALKDMLKEYRPLIVTGDIKDDICSHNIDLFQQEDKYKVIICTNAKAGTGITLNAATYMIMIDTPWTYALTEQCEDRIHRVSNTKPVFIYHLICQNTLDEVVDRIVSTKHAMSDFIIDDKVDEKTVDILRNYIQEI